MGDERFEKPGNMLKRSLFEKWSSRNIVLKTVIFIVRLLLKKTKFKKMLRTKETKPIKPHLDIDNS